MRKIKNTGKKDNYAFIDSQNLNLGILSCGWKLDYKLFRRYLKDRYNITSAYLFIGYKPGNETLYTNLQKYGYILIIKPTLELKDGTVKGNVDAELVLHTMLEIRNFNKAFIVSNDGDFHCLIEHLESVDKLGKIFAPNARYSSLLKKYNKYISRVDVLRSTLELKKTKISGQSKL
jgi:uncharacterized LabA/DUF88 family protein